MKKYIILFIRFLKENQIYAIVTSHYHERLVISNRYSTIYEFLTELPISKYSGLLCNYEFMFDWNKTSEGSAFWHFIHIYWKLTLYREQEFNGLLTQLKSSFSQYIERNEIYNNTTTQTKQLINKIKKEFNI